MEMEPDPIAWLARACALGARVGITSGLSVISANVAVLLSPAKFAAAAFAGVGGTIALACWALTGRIFGAKSNPDSGETGG